MQRHFDLELDELKRQLLAMGRLVERAISASLNALETLDAAAARDVVAADRAIDELENALDERCLDLLALKQPMAVDLRFIAMSMKISTDLERMADLAVDIAQRVIELAGKPLLKPLADIPKLAALSQRMISEALLAFVERDADSAAGIIIMDREADRLRDFIQKELMEDFMAKDTSAVPRAIPLLLIARHLERICDHAANIAEEVIYMVRADIVKHHPERLNPE
ncbi:MAG: phosphate signaling complex protein PhoU [Elusimicrobia bacterium]|nr:phosphate signaling complex protein PhoU [Elusimicrobiota bacterium]